MILLDAVVSVSGITNCQFWPFELFPPAARFKRHFLARFERHCFWQDLSNWDTRPGRNALLVWVWCDVRRWVGWDAMQEGGLYEVGYKLLVLLAACCRPTAIRRHRLFTTTGDTLPLVQEEGRWGGISCYSPPPINLSYLPLPSPLASRQEARCSYSSPNTHFLP